MSALCNVDSRASAFIGDIACAFSTSLVDGWGTTAGRSGAGGHFVLSFGFDIEFGGRQATLTELYLEERARGRGFGAGFVAETRVPFTKRW